MTFHPTNNPLFWQQTADTCLAQGRFEKAAEAYLRLSEILPNEADAWKGRGKALLSLDRAADAAGCLERALLLAEDDELRKTVTISNPLGEDFSIMRTISLNGILTSLATNYNRRNKDVRLYELGNIYLPHQVPVTELPEERMQFT